VNQVPTRILRGPINVTLALHSIVRFHCEATSDPATVVNITWRRGNAPIVSDGLHVYENRVDRSLVLNLTNEEDGGRSFIATYTCRATNGFSLDSRTARLRPPLLITDNDNKTAVVWPSTAWTTFSGSTGSYLIKMI